MRGRKAERFAKGPARKLVRWDDDEWNELTRLAWGIRAKNPSLTLIEVIKRAQQQFPKDRQRSLRTIVEVQPIVDRISEYDLSLKKKLEQLTDEVSKLRSHAEQADRRLTRGEVILDLTDDEVANNFTDRLLKILSPAEIIDRLDTQDALCQVPTPQLLGEAVTRFTEELLAKQVVTHHVTQHTNGKEPMRRQTESLPVVIVMGALPSQQQTLIKEFEGRAKLTFTKKSSAVALPEYMDHFFIWCNFVSHKMEIAVKSHLDKLGRRHCLVKHHGGMTQLIAKIDASISEKNHAVPR